MTESLRVEGLTKRFHPDLPPVVQGVSFGLQRGEIFALLGPSGCGKTTTLRLIAGFESPDAGEVYLDGQPIGMLPPERRRIGFVFQDYALFPHLTVEQNVAFGLRGMTGKRRRERALEVLQMVGMTVFKDRKPGELSGGQQQRVALARAIAPGPKVVLLDEPFSSLDAGLRQATRDEVRTLLKQNQIASVLVTHDQEEALSLADRLGVMRSGRLEQIGTPEEVYLRPATPFVAQFLGRTNLLPGEARGLEAVTALGKLALAGGAVGPVMLSLRPEHLRLEAGGEAEVIAREFKGHDLTYRVRLSGKEYLVHEASGSNFRPGDRVRIRVVAPAVVVGQHENPAERAQA
ncbi:MAG: iron ABC transporter ATP-binding protein [Meiothermus sp.]